LSVTLQSGLTQIAEALLEYETLSGDELRSIAAGNLAAVKGEWNTPATRGDGGKAKGRRVTPLPPSTTTGGQSLGSGGVLLKGAESKA
jgi:hypothetical protein